MTTRVETYARQRGLVPPVNNRSDKSVPELQSECLARGIEFKSKDRKPKLSETLQLVDTIEWCQKHLTFRQNRRLRKKGYSL